MIRSLIRSLGLLFICSCAMAQVVEPSMPGWVLPWDDDSAGPTDLSHLNHIPAGKMGRVGINAAGHLQVGDHRLRFWGVNITAESCFPEEGVAKTIAGRLAKFGVNMVRLHHMDAAWARRSLIAYDRGNSLTLDPVNLDRLDRLVAALKAAGIYVDINLLCARRFNAGDGLPKSIELLAWKQQHAVAMFDPKLIQLQKQFAKQLLDHRNPYTRLRYAEDPAVALVEINNENGLVHAWMSSELDHLPGPWSGQLQQRWAKWLAGRYKTLDQLKKAWQPKDQPLGDSVIANGLFDKSDQSWTLEQHGTVKAEMQTVPIPDNDRQLPGKTLVIKVDQADGINWHLQLAQVFGAVAKGRIMTLRFAARADKPRQISVLVGQSEDPWQPVGLASTVKLTEQWQYHTLTFTVSQPTPRARLLLTDLNQLGARYELADVSLRPGGAMGLPLEPQTLTIERMPIVRFSDRPWATVQAKADWVAFLLSVEGEYWQQMRRYIRAECGYTGLQIGSATLNSPASLQAGFGLTDTHAYWCHPVFQGGDWNPDRWTVANKSMVNDPPGTIGDLAAQHVAGLPQLVSEYQHSSPNTYSSEGPLLIGAYGGFQDWDGIFFFDYTSQPRWDAGYFETFFNMNQHPNKMVNLAAGAWLFRRGDVHRAKKQVEVSLDRQSIPSVIAATGRAWSVLSSEGLKLRGATALQHGMGMSFGTATDNQLEQTTPAIGQKTYRSDTGQLVWDVSRKDKGVVTINAPRCRAVIGYVAGRSFTLGDVRVQPGKTRQDWCTVTLTVTEGDDVASMQRGLITATGDTANADMQWTSVRRESVGRHWGHRPSQVEVIDAMIYLPLPAERVQVWALDEKGQRRSLLPVVADSDGCRFRIGRSESGPTLWYAILVADAPGATAPRTE